ncbi:hypothetical protein GCK32_006474 [Trichostrongylus colubriformis]|uniref:Methyltransferase domain-containing protein n=1 Tax=Trichostrongylus colubriformis TaxID=6319 RepID=A0AAN8EY99_TRICO
MPDSAIQDYTTRKGFAYSQMFRTTIFVVALLIASTVSLFYFINYGNGPSLSLAYQGLLRYSAGNTSTFAAAPNTWVRDYFAERAPMRASLLSFVPENTFATLYNVLEPEYYIQSCSAVLINHFYALCPNLVRVGNLNDGGKFVCNPRMLPMGNCSIYSLGIREDISFEQDLQAFNNHACALYGYDKDPSKHETISAYERINGKVMTLRIASISRPDEDEYTLDDLAKKNGDNSTSIEILKMDIEGGEHSALIPFLRKYRVCQLLLEIHGDPIMHDVSPPQKPTESTSLTAARPFVPPVPT